MSSFKKLISVEKSNFKLCQESTIPISIHIILNKTTIPCLCCTHIHMYVYSLILFKQQHTKKAFLYVLFRQQFFFCYVHETSLGWMSRTEHLMEIQFWTRKMHLFFPYVVFVCLLFYYLRSKENKCWMYTLPLQYHIYEVYILNWMLYAIYTSILKQTTRFFDTHKNIQRIRRTKLNTCPF